MRRGASIAGTAERFRVSRATVRLWVGRAGRRRLDRVDWSERTPGRRRPVNRTSTDMEDLVLSMRTELRETSDLGEFGAAAIHTELLRRAIDGPPSVRTIGRALARRGALDGRKRTRRPPPPRGWYLPDLAAGETELDSFDVVEGLVIQDGPEVEVLNGSSLHGGLPASWPRASITAKGIVEAIVSHWRQNGCPTYAQFDNDTRFQGPHQHPDAIGRVSRLCLSLGVVPVFAPPREPGFQACIENFNGRWQAKVWTRFHHETLAQLQTRSARYIAAWRARAAARIEAAPKRQPVPKRWCPDFQAPLEGRIIFLRRTDEQGKVNVLAHEFALDTDWPHRLVRAEVDLDGDTIAFYALRRRTPDHQRLIKTVKHRVPRKVFRE